jgi:hypothetical protein
MKNKIMVLVLLVAAVCFGKEYFYGARFDNWTTAGVTYVGEAASNHPQFAETNAVWKIVKIDTNGVFNLEIGGNQGYVGAWSDISNYATNTPLWK